MHVARSPTLTEGSTVALKAFPPTIWCKWAEGAFPGSTTGSSLWTVRVEHPNRMAACAGPARERKSHFIVSRTWRTTITVRWSKLKGSSKVFRLEEWYNDSVFTYSSLVSRLRLEACSQGLRVPHSISWPDGKAGWPIRINTLHLSPKGALMKVYIRRWPMIGISLGRIYTVSANIHWVNCREVTDILESRITDLLTISG